MDQFSFLGAGMKFPPQINPNTGRFAVSQGAANVKESIYIILMTNMGERWLKPAFGSQLMSYTFMDLSPTMLSMLSGDIRDTLLEQEPRISEVAVDFSETTNDGCLIIDIRYRVRESNSPDNLVFPFYIGGVSEEVFDE